MLLLGHVSKIVSILLSKLSDCHSAFDTRAVYDLHVSVIIGVRELTTSIFYARCLLLGYVRSALCLLILRKPCGCACIFISYACIKMNKSATANAFALTLRWHVIL